jgi:hypothetical protein
MNLAETFMKIAFIITLPCYLIFVGRIAVFYFLTIKHWKKAPATIISNNVIYEQSGEDGGWKEAVKYKFVIDGVDYENDCISKNMGILYPFKHQAKQSKFRNDKKIMITYNPENPKESVIDDKFDALNVILPIAIFTVIYFVLF